MASRRIMTVWVRCLMALLLLVCAPAMTPAPERSAAAGLEIGGFTVEPAAHPNEYSITPRKIVATAALARGGPEPSPDQPFAAPEDATPWLGVGCVAARAPPAALVVSRHPSCSAPARAPPLA